MSKPTFKLNITSVQLFKTSDGRSFENQRDANTHEIKCMVAKVLAPTLQQAFSAETFNSIADAVDAVRELAKTFKIAPDVLVAEASAIVGESNGSTDATVAAPAANTTVSTGAVQPVSRGDLLKAKRLVNSYEGKKGKKPNVYHEAVALIARHEASKPAKPTKAEKPAAEKKQPTAKKTATPKETTAPKASSKQPKADKKPLQAPTNLAEAKAIVDALQGKPGKKPAVYHQALQMISAGESPKPTTTAPIQQPPLKQPPVPGIATGPIAPGSFPPVPTVPSNPAFPV